MEIESRAVDDFYLLLAIHNVQGSSSLRVHPVHALGTADKNWVGHEEVELREHGCRALSACCTCARGVINQL